MNRRSNIVIFLLFFLTFDVFAQVRDEIEKLATPAAHQAAQTLSSMGKKIIPELKEALQHKNLQVRQFSTAILCEVDLKS